MPWPPPHWIRPRRSRSNCGQSQRSSLLQSQVELQDRKLAQYLQRAERAESEGNVRMARANYRLAIGIAAEPFVPNYSGE